MIMFIFRIQLQGVYFSLFDLSLRAILAFSREVKYPSSAFVSNSEKKIDYKNYRNNIIK